jgi:hypothetical protein
VEKHSTSAKPEACDNAVKVADDFDFKDMMDFYGISIVGEKDDVWQVVEECPGVGVAAHGLRQLLGKEETADPQLLQNSELGWRPVVSI